jgi:hypothetical protein
MSNDREFDFQTQMVLDMSEPKPPQDREEWTRVLQSRLRFLYRAGGRAALEKRYSLAREQDDVLDRVRWLVEHEFVNADVALLLNEVERCREQETALKGSYGVTDADIRSMLGEGFHTAFRKAVDHPYATVIHKLIRELPDGDYGAVVDFVAGPLIAMLREAQKKEAAE